MTRIAQWLTQLAVAVACAGLIPAAGYAQLEEWDQERVTSIAKELSEATQGIEDSLRKEPPPTVGSNQAKGYYRLKQTVRRIKTEARHLANQLEAGKGHDETLPIYESLMELVRDGREQAHRIFMSSFLLDKIAVTGDARRRLAPYYDAKALEDFKVPGAGGVESEASPED